MQKSKVLPETVKTATFPPLFYIFRRNWTCVAEMGLDEMGIHSAYVASFNTNGYPLGATLSLVWGTPPLALNGGSGTDAVMTLSVSQCTCEPIRFKLCETS